MTPASKRPYCECICHSEPYFCEECCYGPQDNRAEELRKALERLVNSTKGWMVNNDEYNEAWKEAKNALCGERKT